MPPTTINTPNGSSNGKYATVAGRPSMKPRFGNGSTICGGFHAGTAKPGAPSPAKASP